MAENLVLNEKLSDVILKVRHDGYSWRFPVHSLMLNAHSSVLREMLEDRAHDDHDAPLTIVGMSPETALAIINYIYTGKIPTTVTSNLLVASAKYGLDDLRDKLEENLLPNMTVEEACDILNGLELEQPQHEECSVKKWCLSILEKHAYRVFASDLVLTLNRKTLQKLLESNKLNIPDETLLFWGIWRWGTYHSSRVSRTLEEGNVISYIEDLLKLVRDCSIKCKDGIPENAAEKFNRCAGRRTKFYPPDDSLEQGNSLQTCRAWQEVFEAQGGVSYLGLQMSLTEDTMLVGLSFEACSSTKLKGYILVFEETRKIELLRQEINCTRISGRKLSRTAEPESWIETDVVLHEPLILRRSEIYSIYLLLEGTEPWALPRALLQSQNRKKSRVGSTFLQFHGQFIVAIRELYFVPNMTATWGLRK